VDAAEDADLVINDSVNSDLPIAVNFYEEVRKGNTDHSFHFRNECVIFTKEGKSDLLATCFYLVNSLQEYAVAGDTYGRFPYKRSLQARFNNPTQNLVQAYFDELAKHPKISAIRKNTLSRVFISHDIDNITSAWLEDGFAAFKKGQIHHIFRLLFNAAIQKPDWFNMDHIMRIHDTCDLKSTFFWLAHKGRSSNGVMNADYDVSSKPVQDAMLRVKKHGSENGIHKSAAETSFAQESEKLGFTPIANRYHFLKFTLPHAYAELEAAGILLDASLGFSEQYGFRNNYGQPFQPYDLNQDRAFNLVEVPLHVMDRTFYHKKTPVNEIARTVIDFFEANKYNCVLSLLWHNNFFDSIKYGGYLEEYKKIIAYLCESGHTSINQRELIDKYRIFATHK
jgi:hypothetical protein